MTPEARRTTRHGAPFAMQVVDQAGTVRDTLRKPHDLLLAIRFYPPTPAQLVSRELLVEQLQLAVRCTLILVSAPSGYGKTTLLALMASVHKRTRRLAFA